MCKSKDVAQALSVFETHGWRAGFIIGGSLSISPSPYPSERNNSPRAWGVGLYSPQVGVSYNYVFENGVILNK